METEIKDVAVVPVAVEAVVSTAVAVEPRGLLLAQYCQQEVYKLVVELVESPPIQERLIMMVHREVWDKAVTEAMRLLQIKEEVAQLYLVVQEEVQQEMMDNIP